MCVYLSGFVALSDACITTNVLFRKLSISIDIGIISCNDVFTDQPKIKPRSQTVAVMPYDNITLTCVVVRVGPITVTYSWHRVDGDIPAKSTGVHSSELTIPWFGLADEGQFYCIIKKFGHCGKTDNITLTLDGENCTSYYVASN